MKRKPHLNARSILYIGLLWLLVTLSCGGSVTGPRLKTAQDLVPLQKGNYWTYDYVLRIGNEIGPTNSTSIVVDTTLIWEGEEWFGYHISDSVSYHCDSLGWWELRFNNGFDGFKQLRLKYPVEKGDFWYYHHSPTDSTKMEVFSTSTSTDTPLGTIDDCIQFGELRLDRLDNGSNLVWES